MDIPSEWWKTFFSGINVDSWVRFVPQAWARVEVDFFVREAGPAAPARILDVPCGGGRHALELASRGFDVTGVDLSSEFLAHARAESGRRALGVKWEQRDMRDLPWPGAFDGALCMGNSFGYMDDAANAAYVQAVARALKPGSRFLIDTGMAAESFLPNFQERRWYSTDGLLFLIYNEYDQGQSRMNTELTYVQDGKVEKRWFSQRVFLFRELAEMLRAAGFRELKAFSGTESQPYRIGSERLLLLATR